MTDTRLPGRWLTDVKFEELSDRAWRTFCGSLMWSNEQGTDGDVPKRAMKYLHPDGVDAKTRSELLSSRLWAPNGDGVKVANWTATQSTAEELNAKRAANRDRQRKHRAAAKSAAPTTPVMRDVTRDVTGESLGQDRQGQERTGQEISEAFELQNSGALNWPVRTPGDPQFHEDSEEPF